MGIIEIKQLSKHFNGLKAVDNIDLDIKKGEIFGLLGPNGAGKTTTISMLATLLKPTSGEAKLCGHSIVNQKNKVRDCIGIVFQDFSLDLDLTGAENLDFHGRLYNIPTKKRAKRIDEVLKLVELEDKKNKLVKTYSGGMKRRLEIARGLMHNPAILFLDEPTIGLDPQTRRNLWDYIKKFNETQKTTIILTTHYMDEADFLCHRIGIVDHGKIVALDTPTNLKKVLGGDVITLEVDKPEILKTALEKEKITNTKIINKELRIVADNGAMLIPKLIKLAEHNNLEITSVTTKNPSLEDVFIHYTGHQIREEEGNSKDSMRLQMRVRGR